MDAHHLVELKKNRNIPEFRAGDTVQVNYRVTEGERSRIQPFIGVVIRRTGGTSPAACFTVRHIAKGFGVERTFPIYSPHVDSVLIQRYGKVRRAKLFYLRELSGRAARIKELTVVPEWRKASAILAPLEDVIEPEEELEAVEEVAEEPVAEVATEEPVAEEAAVEATETSEAEAATEEAATDEAPAEEAAAEPEAEAATEEPVAEAATEEPVAEEAAAEVPAGEPEEAPAEEAPAADEPEAKEDEPKA